MKELKKKVMIEAMEAAGYDLDEFSSTDEDYVWNGEWATIFHTGTMKETFAWLDGVVFDDPEISDKVERILHPYRFAPEKKYYRPEADIKGEDSLTILKWAEKGYLSSDYKTLEWLKDILVEEGRLEEAETASFLLEEANEEVSRFEYSIGRWKYDLSAGYTSIEDLEWADNISVSFTVDQRHQELIVCMSEESDHGNLNGATRIRFEEFFEMNHQDFEDRLMDLHFYGLYDDAG